MIWYQTMSHSSLIIRFIWLHERKSASMKGTKNEEVKKCNLFLTWENEWKIFRNKFTLCCSDLNSEMKVHEVWFPSAYSSHILSAFEFKYCSFLIETLISTFYDRVLQRLHIIVYPHPFSSQKKIIIEKLWNRRNANRVWKMYFIILK